MILFVYIFFLTCFVYSLFLCFFLVIVISFFFFGFSRVFVFVVFPSTRVCFYLFFLLIIIGFCFSSDVFFFPSSRVLLFPCQCPLRVPVT